MSASSAVLPLSSSSLTRNNEDYRINSAPVLAMTTDGTPSLEDDDEAVRRGATHNVLLLTVWNTYAAGSVFLWHLIALESWISIALSVGFTLYVYDATADSTAFDANGMNWVLLSFAVILPISASTQMAFNRREAALIQLAILRSTLVQIYHAHTVWDWSFSPAPNEAAGQPKSEGDWLEHGDKVLLQIVGLCTDLTGYLTLPNSTLSRHKHTSWGMKEAAATQNVATRWHGTTWLRATRLARLCEVLKRQGLPVAEAARIRQWEQVVLESVERLRVIKMYRTPQGLRNFARLFSILLPAFYAPYYAQLARDLNSLGTGLTFAAITSLALTALFETVEQMEDPFVSRSLLDGVHVSDELLKQLWPQLLALRTEIFPTAPPILDGPTIDSAPPPPSRASSLWLVTE